MSHIQKGTSPMYSTTAFQFQPISVSFFCLNPIFEFGGRGTSAVNRDAVNQDLLCMLSPIRRKRDGHGRRGLQ